MTCPRSLSARSAGRNPARKKVDIHPYPRLSPISVFRSYRPSASRKPGFIVWSPTAWPLRSFCIHATQVFMRRSREKKLAPNVLPTPPQASSSKSHTSHRQIATKIVPPCSSRKTVGKSRKNQAKSLKPRGDSPHGVPSASEFASPIHGGLVRQLGTRTCSLPPARLQIHFPCLGGPKCTTHHPGKKCRRQVSNPRLQRAKPHALPLSHSRTCNTRRCTAFYHPRAHSTAPHPHPTRTGQTTGQMHRSPAGLKLRAMTRRPLLL